MFSAINVLRSHQWTCGQKDVRALLVGHRTPKWVVAPSGGSPTKGRRGWGTELCAAVPKCPPSPSTPPCFHLAAPSASSVVLGHWSPTSGWDNPYLPGSTVWPPLINLGANLPFKPFPAKTRLGRYDSKFCFGHCLLTSVLTVGTLSCRCCWGTRYFFRDGAGSLVIVTLIGDKVQSKN